MGVGERRNVECPKGATRTHAVELSGETSLNQCG